MQNGCGLGATWHKELLHDVGRTIGIEARAKHNGFVHTGNRLDQMGLTFYTPNINLVKVRPKFIQSNSARILVGVEHKKFTLRTLI